MNVCERAPVALTPAQIRRLRAVLAPFPKPALPPLGRWRRASEDAIWWQVIGQVAVVGSVAGWERLSRDDGARTQLAWARLCALAPGAARTALWRELRRCGVRFVARDRRADRKSLALARNLAVLAESGGPRAFVACVAGVRGDLARAERLMAELHYVKEKGARDMLIGLGLARDVVALDVRVVNILKALGVTYDYRSITAGAGYLAVEQALREAAPKLGVDSLAELDRLLFGNYREIVEALGAPPPDGRRGHRST